eukprot:31511-Pelagococcus_subviridis.AAC.1
MARFRASGSLYASFGIDEEVPGDVTEVTPSPAVHTRPRIALSCAAMCRERDEISFPLSDSVHSTPSPRLRCACAAGPNGTLT